jgi:hypothetical protein
VPQDAAQLNGTSSTPGVHGRVRSNVIGRVKISGSVTVIV